MTERDPETGHFLKTGTLFQRARMALVRANARERAKAMHRENGRFATRPVKIEYDWRDRKKDARLTDRTNRTDGVHYRRSVGRTFRTAFSDSEFIRQQLDRQHPRQAHFRVIVGEDGGDEE